jgi:hypothetical protein
MPSGRDSFRRNRVAPIAYCLHLLRLVLRLATGPLYHPHQGRMRAKPRGRFGVVAEACFADVPRYRARHRPIGWQAPLDGLIT